MRAIHTFVNDAVTDLRCGNETWRVRALILLYAIAGAAINIVFVMRESF